MASTKGNLEVLFEDNHLIIVNKKSGDIVQGDKTGDTPLSDIIKQYIKEKYNKPGNVFLGVVHRLDRPTTGIIVFARTSKALERFNKMLRNKDVHKTYWAVVKNKPKELQNTLIGYLRKNPKNNKSTSYTSEIEGSKKAILHYKLIKSLDNYHLLEVDLETGRHHQIRCQLSSIGSPIRGDLKYGFDRSNKDASIHLHARKIEFTHPVTKDLISIIAPTPNEVIWNACN
ncbi:MULTISPECIES: RluA family pseudouridine synthase [Flavobacteriaceae]|uniref:RNA pseudouridine synthase n=2 Tax=Flavobacteriaceae TaxID=49546 RepID=A0A4Y8AUG2_9FLAO|nr:MULTISPECIES: RNA pseudouridine synthase [Flavobacteriaceae]TEW75006.1 RNA pseudouridine synthase [Gramella jeungdoensis]GGK42355.1 RNA pseudouridine synthase [Lutibacter litoralis]